MDKFKEFEIYKDLTICSNLLINTNHIFGGSDDWYPLVIRKGDTPKVWLSAKDQNQKIIQLVENSEKTTQIDEFDFKLSTYGFRVTYRNVIIVEAGNHTNESLEVIKLDLRPLGLNIFGDNKSMSIGDNTMSRNTSSNGNVMFGIG